MGFGWLFIGYFLTIMNVPILGIFGIIVRLCGYVLIIMATLKLRKYNRSFDFAMYGAIAMTIVSYCFLAKNIIDKLAVGFLSKTVTSVIEYVDLGCTFVFTALLLWGIYCIAKETEVKKISNSAIRNFVFLSLCYIVRLISYMPISAIKKVNGTFVFIIWVLYFVYSILNIILIFSCYAKICDEDDVEMERKPSRFEVVNRIRDEFDRKSEKARAEDEAYRRERKEKREQRKNRKKK